MKKINLGQTIGILANMGVIAGIVFLGLELRQNNLFIEEEARNSLFQNRLDGAVLRSMDSEGARIWYWQESDEPLSELDMRRRADYMHTSFLRWQHDYQSVQRGTLDREALAITGIIRSWHSTPGIDEVWERRKAAYAPDFVEWMEETIISN